MPPIGVSWDGKLHPGSHIRSYDCGGTVVMTSFQTPKVPRCLDRDAIKSNAVESSTRPCAFGITNHPFHHLFVLCCLGSLHPQRLTLGHLHVLGRKVSTIPLGQAGEEVRESKNGMQPSNIHIPTVLTKGYRLLLISYLRLSIVSCFSPIACVGPDQRREVPSFLSEKLNPHCSAPYASLIQTCDAHTSGDEFEMHILVF
ncbi:hypothetical protein EDB81DRAFT_192615 [Dactylonectria macrodidyma]|uniref:Uncharacterized protein n=1 Tax=Dactylonectria macrodidyma TaxID=307937 RepID=A0A9P9FRS5_9HYPO|nr:hypothetical protein EDB81DRAFT_192615 [Dactylonectria macrodidyma]